LGVIRGAGKDRTTLKYTGAAQAFEQATPASRIYELDIADFALYEIGTGTIGFDLESVSTSNLARLWISGFDTAVRVHSPTTGFAVYNRFYDVTANACTTGFKLSGASSNAHVFNACRFNGATAVGTVGWLIADSNGNSIVNCHNDVCGIHIQLTASAPGATDGNVCWGNRIENVTTGHNVGVDVRHTHIGANYYSAVTNPITDAGTNTTIYDPYYNMPGIAARFQAASAAGGHIRYVREVSGGSSLPFMLLTDENTGAGTPVTLQVAKERNAGQAYLYTKGGVPLFAVNNAGDVLIGGAASTVSAGQISIGSSHASTVGAAGGASALPATPTGYLIVNIDGTNQKLPYYAN
jgi:hypothetical protein